MDIHRFEIRASQIENYLLDLDHPDGGAKARFFFRRGFRLENAGVPASALAEHAMRRWPETGELVHYGIKHRIVAPLPCPDGRTPLICAIWKVETGSATASLVTAYPH